MANQCLNKTALPDIPIVLAKRCYDTALDAYQNGKLKLAYDKLLEAVSINPLNAVYKNRLQFVETEFEAISGKVNEIVETAEEYFQNKDYEKALSEIEKALELTKISNKAETLKSKIVKAIKDKEEKEKRALEAEKAYEAALKLYNNKDYEKALEKIKVSIANEPKNDKYKSLSSKIKHETKRFNDAEEFYKTGTKALHKANFKEALDAFEKALNLVPENKDYEEAYEIAKKGKIILSSCSKNAILTLEGFDKNKADAFIKARNAGRVWYDVEAFAKDFGLEPHQAMLVREKIEFMLKPKPAQGRSLDF